MPVIVDKESINRDILIAFQKCLNDTPLLKITMRQVALKAGISHAKVLYYFDSKQQLMLSYIQHITSLYEEFLHNWAKQKKLDKIYFSDLNQCIGHLLRDVSVLDENGEHMRAFIQIYTLAHYDKSIKIIIEHTYNTWKRELEDILVEYHVNNPEEAAEALLVLIEGILLYRTNVALTDEKVEHLLDYLMG